MVNPPASILTVMAHADDAELWAGGTLALHAVNGAGVTVALPRPDGQREQEAAAGAKVLGASLELLEDATTAELQQLLTRLRPVVLVTHGFDDIHPDHRRIAQTVADALPAVVIATSCPKRVYTCDGYNGLNHAGLPLHLPVIVDVSETWHVKMTALGLHRSQPIDSHFGPMAEALARLHGQRIGCRFAEAFGSMPVLGRMPPTQFL